MSAGLIFFLGLILTWIMQVIRNDLSLKLALKKILPQDLLVFNVAAGVVGATMLLGAIIAVIRASSKQDDVVEEDGSEEE